MLLLLKATLDSFFNGIALFWVPVAPLLRRTYLFWVGSCIIPNNSAETPSNFYSFAHFSKRIATIMINYTRLLYLVFFLVGGTLAANAQFVNMEETWQEFLSNKKTANISQLPKPEKSQPANYIKYSLIYANTYLCGDNIEEADNMMQEIERMGKEIRDRVPGFEERYIGLQKNIAAYKSLVPLWSKFKSNKTSVSREDVQQYSDASRICERGTLTKYFYMIAHDYLCEKDLYKARDVYDTKIKRLVATTFNPHDVEGLGEEVDKMAQYWVAMDELEPAWEAFSATGISPGMSEEMPVFRCYILPNIKTYLIKANYDICTQGAPLLEKIKVLRRQSPEPLPSDVIGYIEDIERQVKAIRTDIVILNTYWKKFLGAGKLPSDAAYSYEFKCDREAEIKAQLLDGLTRVCDKGAEALQNIAEIRREHRPDMSAETQAKLKELKTLVSASSGDVSILEEAWADFLPDNELSKDYALVFDYCEKIAQVQAHIIEGTVNVCEKGEQELAAIDDLLVEYDITIDPETQSKLDALKAKVTAVADGQVVINQAWAYFVEYGKVSADYEYEYEYPCNRVLDVRAALLDGYTNPCLSGEYGLKEVDKVMKKYQPELDQATADYIQSLKNRLANESGNIAKLTKVWEDFVPDNQLSGELDVEFAYCDKIAEVRALIMDGTLNFCSRGKQRLADIYKVQEDYLLTLDRTMEDKLEQLYQMVQQGEPELEGLQQAWKLAGSTDKLSEVDPSKISLEEYYCDDVSTIKAWVIRGLMQPCKDGRRYLTKIDGLQRKNSVVYQDELDYQVELLRVYVGRCN